MKTRAGIALLVSMLISACATEGEIPPKSLAEPVLVVSLLGDRYEDMHFGITIFTNAQSVVPIHPWKLDLLYEASLANALVEHGARQANAPAVDKARLWAPFNPETNRNFLGLPEPDWAAAELPIREAAAATHASAVVMLLPSSTDDFVGHTNGKLSGLGIYSHGGAHASQYAYLSAVAILFDGATGKVVKRSTVSAKDTNLLGMISKGDLPQAELPESFEGKHFADLDAEQRTTLQQTFRSLFDAAAAEKTVSRLLD